MKKAAFIGVGNMGGALARAVCRAAGPDQVVLYNRTRGKAQALADELGCGVVDSVCDAVWAAEYLFVGVKPKGWGPFWRSWRPRSGIATGLVRTRWWCPWRRGC